jgi:hypothetical protein
VSLHPSMWREGGRAILYLCGPQHEQRVYSKCVFWFTVLIHIYWVTSTQMSKILCHAQITLQIVATRWLTDWWLKRVSIHLIYTRCPNMIISSGYLVLQTKIHHGRTSRLTQ